MAHPEEPMTVAESITIRFIKRLPPAPPTLRCYIEGGGMWETKQNLDGGELIFC